MTTANIIKLIVSVGIPLAVGAVAGMFTAKAVPEWFSSLNKPVFSPPDWLFGPVWTVLYLLMGISLFLIWREEPGNTRTLAIVIFIVQLFLNFVWSFLFFYFKMIGFALLEIIVLWLNILLMIFVFYRINPVSAYINIPYLLWVSFASVLNAAYFFLNKGR